MVKDEDLCVHCGLCAERCPTAAWDMQEFTLYACRMFRRTKPTPRMDRPNKVPKWGT